MFESKDKLRIMELEEANEKLEEDCRWYRHGNDVKNGLIEKLSEENRKLIHDIEELEYRERYGRDSFDTSMIGAQCNKIKRLTEENEKLKQYNENQQITITRCLDSIYEVRQEIDELKKQKSDDRMTLGEFDKAMEKIAIKYDLHFDIYCDHRKRTYKFVNPRNCGDSLHIYCCSHCGWAKIVVNIDDFAVSESQLRDIENNIVRSCL